MKETAGIIGRIVSTALAGVDRDVTEAELALGFSQDGMVSIRRNSVQALTRQDDEDGGGGDGTSSGASAGSSAAGTTSAMADFGPSKRAGKNGDFADFSDKDGDTDQ